MILTGSLKALKTAHSGEINHSYSIWHGKMLLAIIVKSLKEVIYKHACRLLFVFVTYRSLYMYRMIFRLLIHLSK